MKHVVNLLWLVGCRLLLIGGQPALGQPATTPGVIVGAAPLTCLPSGDITGADGLKTIALDFSCRCFDKDALSQLNALKQGDMYRLRILHINPLLYKIAVGIKDTSKIVGLTFPAFASVGLSDLNGLAAGLTPVAVATKAVLSTQVFENAKVMAPADKRRVVDQINSDEEAAKELIESYAKEVQAEVSTLTDLNKRIDAIFLEYGNKLNYTRLEYIYLSSHQQDLPNINDIGNAAKKLNDTRTELAELRKKADGLNKVYADNIAALQQTVANDAGLKKGDEKVKATYQKLTEDLTKVEATVSADNIQRLVKSLTDAVNNSVMEYVSLPLQFSQQSSLLRIHIIPRGTDNILQEFHTQLVYPIDRQHFWGVSSGFFVSHLHSEAYSAQAQPPSNSTTSYKLVAEDPGKFEFGASAMVRYGVFLGKKSQSVGVQAGFGPALAVSTKVRPRLLAGGGLIFGANHKFLVDGGVALGYVDRLSNAYNLTDSYSVAPDNAVVSTLKTGFYFGFHYLFTK